MGYGDPLYVLKKKKTPQGDSLLLFFIVFGCTKKRTVCVPAWCRALVHAVAFAIQDNQNKNQNQSSSNPATNSSDDDMKAEDVETIMVVMRR